VNLAALSSEIARAAAALRIQARRGAICKIAVCETLVLRPLIRGRSAPRHVISPLGRGQERLTEWANMD